MLKVLKFGGSSMADAHQFAKVKAIVDSDPSRRVVVVSAAGKRSRDDHKLTDLLYLCYAHLAIRRQLRRRVRHDPQPLSLHPGRAAPVHTAGGGVRRPAGEDGPWHQSGRAGEPGRVLRRPPHGGLSGLRFSGQHLLASLPAGRYRGSARQLRGPAPHRLRPPGGDPRLLRGHARRQRQDLHPRRQRHHRRAGGGGAGRRRLRKLD